MITAATASALHPPTPPVTRRGRGIERIPLVGSYLHWLHTRWPAGTVETLPEVHEDGTTRIPGLFVVGDLTGVPLLKLAADSGARAVGRIAGESGFRSREEDGTIPLAIVSCLATRAFQRASPIAPSRG